MSIPFLWISLYLRWQPGHQRWGPPQGSEGALEQAVPSAGAQPTIWGRGAWGTCQHFLSAPRPRKLLQGDRHSHHTATCARAVLGSARAVPTTQHSQGCPRHGGTMEARHFWRSTFFPDFQGFLLKPVRNRKGLFLGRNLQGHPRLGKTPLPRAMLRAGSWKQNQSCQGQEVESGAQVLRDIWR